MSLWSNYDVAKAAKDTADEAKAAVVAINLRLDNIMGEWRRNWDDVKADLRSEAQRRDDDQKEWRNTLGKRLDKQDHWQAVVVWGVVATLLSVVGYLITHLPAFHGFQT